MLNTAVLSPPPRARVRMTARLNAGALRSEWNAARRSDGTLIGNILTGCGSSRIDYQQSQGGMSRMARGTAREICRRGRRAWSRLATALALCLMGGPLDAGPG